MDVPKYLTEKQVSEMIGRARQSLANDRCTKRGIPYSKLRVSGNRGSIRYSLEDVVAFMEGNKINTAGFTSHHREGG